MNWTLQRVEHLAREERTTLDPADLGDEEVDHYSIPALDEHGEPERQPASEIHSHKQLLRGGEILISRLNPRKARVLTIPPLGARKALASGEFVVLRPTQIEARFLEYLLLSERTRQDLDGAVQSVTRSHQRIRPEQLLKMEVRVPVATRAQRVIADFLDTETTRIDALITKKRRMIDLGEERRWVAFLARVEGSDAPMVPFRRGLRFITDGPFGSAFTSDEYTADGIAVIRLGNIGFAKFRGDELAHLRADRMSEFHRYRVREGDVLFAGLGDERNHAGRACVAPDLGPAIVKGKCFCARVEPERADPEFVSLYFSSPAGAELLAVEARGSTRSMINLEIVKSVALPLPSLEAQRTIAARTRQEWGDLDALQQRLTAQIELLQEHRQALITAAVTGDLEVPGVAA